MVSGQSGRCHCFQQVLTDRQWKRVLVCSIVGNLVPHYNVFSSYSSIFVIHWHDNRLSYSIRFFCICRLNKNVKEKYNNNVRLKMQEMSVIAMVSVVMAHVFPIHLLVDADLGKGVMGTLCICWF